MEISRHKLVRYLHLSTLSNKSVTAASQKNLNSHPPISLLCSTLLCSALLSFLINNPHPSQGREWDVRPKSRCFETWSRTYIFSLSHSLQTTIVPASHAAQSFLPMAFNDITRRPNIILIITIFILESLHSFDQTSRMLSFAASSLME